VETSSFHIAQCENGLRRWSGLGSQGLTFERRVRTKRVVVLRPFGNRAAGRIKTQEQTLVEHSSRMRSLKISTWPFA
jgi:hypothetical protein